MLQLILTLGLALTSTPQDGQDPVIDLEAAVEGGASVRIVRALALAGEIEDPRVVKACFQALVLEDAAVRLAAIEALRFNPHAGALQVLHSQLRKGSAVTADPALEAAVVRAIAQHGSEESITLLAKGPLDATQPVLGRARILGLGNLGSRRSVAALLDLGTQLPDDQRLLFADELRLALGRATGADLGHDVDAWAGWWEASKGGHALATDDSELPTLCALEWRAYWTSRAALATPAPVRPTPKAAARAAGRPQAVEASAARPAAKGEAAEGEPNGDARSKDGDASRKGSDSSPKGKGAASGNAKAGKQAGGGKNGKRNPNGAKRGKPGVGGNGAGKNAPAKAGSEESPAAQEGEPANGAANEEPQGGGPN